MVTVESLLRVDATVEGVFYREHVTPYLYENAGRFRVRLLEVQPLIPYLGSLRLTVDSREDLENAIYIYDRIQPASEPMCPSWIDIVSLLEREPETRRRMIQQIGLNQK
jgi:spore coat polysaccharide biosynthesis protein SpsF